MAEGNIAKGVGTGTIKGAALGANPALVAASGGLSIPIGAAAGAIFGGTKSTIAERKKKKAQAAIPSLEDPTQTSRLLEVDRIAKNIQAGTDPSTQSAIQAGQQTLAGTQSRLSRVTGGNAGATVDALLKSQRAGGQATNQAIAQGRQSLPFFMNLGTQIANRAEQRSIELSLLNRAQLSAEASQSQKESNVNRNAVLSSGIGQEELAGQVGGASDRIKSLLDNINANKSAEGGDGLVNPNENLQQTSILPENLAPPVGSELGSVNPLGQEVGGLDLGSFAGVASGFGG